LKSGDIAIDLRLNTSGKPADRHFVKLPLTDAVPTDTNHLLG